MWLTQGTPRAWDIDVRDSPTRLIAVGVEFGWGSAGKLSAILHALRGRYRNIAVESLRSWLGADILAPGLIDRWLRLESPQDLLPREWDPDRYRGALVVLDPERARLFTEQGIPTIYVDSLPYLWTEADPTPGQPWAYLAQRMPEVDPSPVLSGIAGLEWVDAIVHPVVAELAQTRQVSPNTALISLGGVGSVHASADVGRNYARAVLGPAIAALRANGVRDIRVVGGAVTGVEFAEGVRGERLSHESFLEAVCRSEHVLMSPGLTGMMEALALGVRPVLLPAQNVSQVHNANWAAKIVADSRIVRWPNSTIDSLAMDRGRSEAERVMMIYREIGQVRTGDRLRLERAVDGALRSAAMVPRQPFRLGFDGADQVVDRIAAMLGIAFRRA